MNKLRLYIFSLFLGSCTYSEFNPISWSIPPELDLNVQNIELKWNEQEYIIEVMTNYNEFTVKSSCDWCNATADVNARIVRLKFDPNKQKEARNGYIRVSIERGDTYSSKDVSFTQRGGESEVINNIDVYWRDGISTEKRKIISNIINNMVFVEGGDFYAGVQDSDPDDINYTDYEYSYMFHDCKPVHKVTLSDFYICKYEMTQKEWMTIMEYNPSSFIGSNLPVDGIEYNDAKKMAERLSELTDLNFSLPSEAQWEYAAIGGRNNLGYIYPGSSVLADVAFVDSQISENSPMYSTYLGGQYIPNELGIYDMAGNVAELCLDYYGEYTADWETDPIGPTDGAMHVKRGGSFDSFDPECTVYYRKQLFGKYYGVRLVINN